MIRYNTQAHLPSDPKNANNQSKQLMILTSVTDLASISTSLYTHEGGVYMRIHWPAGGLRKKDRREENMVMS